ncbi:polyphenol oxidase, chloroplastic-like [Tasmannia lanceolata]|uniref:polyphenol oxidase, chloroplastic-like n=1 Tax=Tasmannia lanceolata TaxID=3420 RepID=UPI004062A198
MPFSTLISTTYHPSIFSKKTNPLSLSKNPPPSTTYHPSCIRSARDEPSNKVNKPITKSSKPDKSLNNLDRRDVLLGLGGLYGATLGRAEAAPITPPDFTTCKTATDNGPPTYCCPPSTTSKIKQWEFPSSSSLMRERKAAHLLTADEIKKYNQAVALMKELPLTDPRNFTQQANVHCAYCDGAYTQAGYTVELQVHASWLFFAWHRWYLYFYERILAKLLNDETLAIPFWNWDAADGMTMPAMFVDKLTPLYDCLRNANHQPPTLINLASTTTTDLTDPELILSNYATMYKQVVQKTTPSLFFGAAYSAGTAAEPGAGSVENVPHNIVHAWTGNPNPNTPNGEDMGILYSAARDPIFFAHHSNVDRLWTIWKTLSGKNRIDFTDTDYLDSSFLFYDENAELVQVKVSDALDPSKLRYGYQDVEILWETKPTTTTTATTTSMLPTKKALAKTLKKKAGEFGSNPRQLGSIIRATVKRPKKSRSKEEKENEEEILVVNLELSRDEFVKFDVYINAEGEKFGGPASSNFIGSSVHLPHSNVMKNMKVNTLLRLPLNEALEDLGAEGDDDVEVIIVPKAGKGEKITIKGIKIEIGV